MKNTTTATAKRDYKFLLKELGALLNSGKDINDDECIELRREIQEKCTSCANMRYLGMEKTKACPFCEDVGSILRNISYIGGISLKNI